MYHAISHRITSKHQANTNSTKNHYLIAVYSCFFRLCLCLHLGFSSVWPFLSSFSCPSTGHIIGLTVSPANNLVPSGLGPWAHVCFRFIFHLIWFDLIWFISLSFFVRDAWYLVLLSSCEVADIYILLLTLSGISGWYFVVVERQCMQSMLYI